MEIEIGITCVLLVALAFLATVDMAFGQLSDVGLRRLITDAEEGTTAPVVPFLNEILDNRQHFRATLLLAIQIVIVALSVLLTSITLHILNALNWFSPARFILIALVAGFLLAALLPQIIPRLIAVRNPEKTLLRLLPFYRPLYQTLSFIAIPWRRTFGHLSLTRPDDVKSSVGNAVEAEEMDEDDLQALIDVGEEEGILEEEEGELIQSIVEFGDTRVSEVMTPRTEIAALPVTANVREARDLIIGSKYSRLPVYRDQIDQIEGIIYVRDLLQYWPEGRETDSITSLLRKPYFIPETKPVADLLKEMQKAHVQLAMVIDEYGGVAGLITIEDILEEIVGEIEDEDTKAEEATQIVETHDGYYDVLGSTEVSKIERLFDIEIEAEDFTTIAGLVINEAGTVPRPGTHLSLHGLDVEVLEADERRILRLRLRRAAPGEVEDRTAFSEQTAPHSSER